MSEQNGLTTLIRDTEDEYIKDFCEAYKDEICTPDGFVVFCKYLEKTAKHVCCGKDGPFQKTRAMRILWAKYILMNPSERIILKDTTTGNTLFFLTRTKTPHIVICKKLDNKWNLVSAFPVSGERAQQYKKGQPPYEFFQKDKNF